MKIEIKTLGLQLKNIALNIIHKANRSNLGINI